MRAKVVVFPIRGRNWCFSRSVDPSVAAVQSSKTPSTLKDLWSKIISPSKDSKVELTVDFASNKMNKAWSNLEKAPQGSFKNKIHGLGLKLLSRVNPSEIFFKSIPKEIDGLDILYPSSLNPRLVRRRLRHIAFRSKDEDESEIQRSNPVGSLDCLDSNTSLSFELFFYGFRGSVIHKKYFYGSAVLLPLTSVFMVLPLPNIPFFWVLFRAYSHWRASQGSEKLLHLVNDASCHPHPSDQSAKDEESSTLISEQNGENSASPWVLQPSKELDKLLQEKNEDKGLSETAISKICQKLYLNPADVKKYRDSVQ